MDIRFINGRNEIINCSELSIKVMGKWLIGITAEQKIVEIEEYKEEKKAREMLEKVGELLSGEKTKGLNAIMIDLREG